MKSQLCTSKLTRTTFILSVLVGLGGAAVSPASAQTGACCRPDGTCGSLTQADCNAAGGFWFGAGSGCAFVRCGAVGACCLPNNTCVFRPLEECTAAGGRFSGEGTRCATTNCTPQQQCGTGTCGVGATLAPLGLIALWASRACRRAAQHRQNGREWDSLGKRI